MFGEIVRMRKFAPLLAAAALVLSGCVILENLEDALFPPMAPNPFATPPAPLGPVSFVETRTMITSAETGEAVDFTVFSPTGEGNGAAVVWILGVNHRPYYHQSLHETLASYGYTVVVPDNRPYRFADMDYHNSILRAATLAVDALSAGRITAGIDPGRIAVGGFSIGGALAAFVAAERPSVRTVFAWAPLEPPFWMRFDSEEFLPFVTQPILLVEGARDTVAVPGAWQTRLTDFAETPPSNIISVVLGEGVHYYFQEPNEADPSNPPTTTTRPDQMGRAIVASLLWLDFQLLSPPAFLETDSN
jgi:dienelactone hydrolase